VWIEPLQFYWFCAAAKFFNSLLSVNSGLLKKIVRAGIALGASHKKCWTAEFNEAREGQLASDRYINCVKAAIRLPIQDFVVDLREQLRAVFRNWMTQILGHTLKNWPWLRIMHGWPRLSRHCAGPSPFAAKMSTAGTE